MQIRPTYKYIQYIYKCFSLPEEYLQRIVSLVLDNIATMIYLCLLIFSVVWKKYSLT